METILELLAILYKFLTFPYQYYRDRPKLTIVIEGRGAGAGLDPSNPGAITHTRRFTFNRILVLHNDSRTVVRGIKLLKPLPNMWVLNDEIPTRLEADSRLRIRMVGVITERIDFLDNELGGSPGDLTGVVTFPVFSPADNLIEFQLENSKGRKFWQYSEIDEVGTATTKVLSKRKSLIA